MDPVSALRRIAFLLERSRAQTYRVKAFRTAAAALLPLGGAEIAARVRAGTLKNLPGIGDRTAGVVAEAVAGQTPEYLRRLEDEAAAAGPLAAGGEDILQSLLGDLHSHSDASDGGSPPEEMAATAAALGHSYLALTDHSPRLTVANGLSAERLAAQIEQVAAINAAFAAAGSGDSGTGGDAGRGGGGFRLLTGIEVDIDEDGVLDQTPEMLGRLDIVVASVHSKLRMASGPMTRRMLDAVADPHTDVLGHCTGRMVGDGGAPGSSRRTGGRPESTFDAAKVFAACADRRVAVEINCRPERLDPPRRLLTQAVEAGCLFSIDTDAHAPGQLDWQLLGCARAEECGVPLDRIVNTWPLDRLLAWTSRNG